MSQLLQFAQLLLAKGISVIPIKPATKVPAIKGWQEYAEHYPDPEDLEEWFRSDEVGISVLPGKLSGIIALDFDYDENGLHEKIQELIPRSLVRKVGAKGFTAFYRYNGEKSHKWCSPEDRRKVVIEILSDKRNCIIPPSIHPDTGQPYRWMDLSSFLNVESNQLPALPDDFVARMNALFGIREPEPYTSPKQYDDRYEAPDLHECAVALNHINPDICRADWIKIGMALHAEFGGAGFEVWDSWSRNGEKYDAKAIQHDWKGFRESGGVNIATLFYLAKEAGYHPVREHTYTEEGFYFLKPGATSESGQGDEKDNKSEYPRIKNCGSRNILLIDPPEQQFLVEGTLPLGVPCLFAAMGDTGKGMLSLNLALQVATGDPPTVSVNPGPESFGNPVTAFGKVVMFTAEDDRDEISRRAKRLDPAQKYFYGEERLFVMALPD